MTKLQFLFALRDRLKDLPQAEMEERLNFYSEMIEDRMEEGLSEEEAVAAVGTVDEIAAQIVGESPNPEEKGKQKRQLKTWEIVLLVLGSPLWVSLLIGVAAIAVSLYAAAWAVIASLWAVFAALIGCAAGSIVCGAVAAVTSSVFTGIALMGAGAVLAGLSIFAFFGCKAATRGLCLLTKKMFTFRREAK